MCDKPKTISRERRWLDSPFAQIIIVDDVGDDAAIVKQVIRQSLFEEVCFVVDREAWPEFQREAELLSSAHLVDLETRGTMVFVCGDGSLIVASNNPRRHFTRMHVRVVVTLEHEMLSMVDHAIVTAS